MEKTPIVTKFYRVDIRKQNRNEQIGEVKELTYAYFSDYAKEFVFFYKDHNGCDTYAIGVPEKYIDTMEHFLVFLDNTNNADKFYHYFFKELFAYDCAEWAKATYNKAEWSLESVLAAIKEYSPLAKLYDYRITNTYTQVDPKDKKESIYVSPLWRIRVIDNKIHLQRAGWHTYEIPNMESLYMVLTANSGSDEDEGIRQNYSKVV